MVSTVFKRPFGSYRHENDKDRKQRRTFVFVFFLQLKIFLIHRICFMSWLYRANREDTFCILNRCVKWNDMILQ